MSLSTMMHLWSMSMKCDDVVELRMLDKRLVEYVGWKFLSEHNIMFMDEICCTCN
jgi:hypothetical protein